LLDLLHRGIASAIKHSVKHLSIDAATLSMLGCGCPPDLGLIIWTTIDPRIASPILLKRCCWDVASHLFLDEAGKKSENTRHCCVHKCTAIGSSCTCLDKLLMRLLRRLLLAHSATSNSPAESTEQPH
jgi:hypothetical protein